MRHAMSSPVLGLLLPALCLAALGLGPAGCAPQRAELVYADMGRSATATVEISQNADEVYAAGIAVGRADRLLVIQKTDRAEHTIWLRKGSQDAVLKAVPTTPDHSRLIVDVASGADREADKRLALRTACRVCAALGVAYAVAEQTRKEKSRREEHPRNGAALPARPPCPSRPPSGRSR